MAKAIASLNAKLPEEEKRQFVENAEAIGLSPSAAIRVFVRAFNECQGFPFAVRRAYPMGPEERRAFEELDAQIKEGSARTYGSFGELVAEIDAELASEGGA